MKIKNVGLFIITPLLFLFCACASHDNHPTSISPRISEPENNTAEERGEGNKSNTLEMALEFAQAVTKAYAPRLRRKLRAMRKEVEAHTTIKGRVCASGNVETTKALGDTGEIDQEGEASDEENNAFQYELEIKDDAEFSVTKKTTNATAFLLKAKQGVLQKGGEVEISFQWHF